MISAGLEALDWLAQAQRCEINRHFVPIGSQGFYRRAARRPAWISSHLKPPVRFPRACKRTALLETAAGAMKHGRPSTGSSATTIYNFLFMIPSPAAARDGLHPDRANENQGADTDTVVSDRTAGNTFASRI